MKYSNWIGVAAAALLLYACTLVWITAGGKTGPIEIGGFYNKGFDEFGRPGMMHLYLTIPAILLFLIPKLWAKRTNVFVTALNMSWGLRNLYLVGMTCPRGICPNKQLGLWLMLASCVIMFIMSLFPKVELPVAAEMNSPKFHGALEKSLSQKEHSISSR
jgi:hypothetical protein